jgi:hypothetical protein
MINKNLQRLLFKSTQKSSIHFNKSLKQIQKKKFSEDFGIDFSDEEEMDYLEKDETTSYSIAQIIKSQSGIEIPENYKENVLSKMLSIE